MSGPEAGILGVGIAVVFVVIVIFAMPWIVGWFSKPYELYERYLEWVERKTR